MLNTERERSRALEVCLWATRKYEEILTLLRVEREQPGDDQAAIAYHMLALVTQDVANDYITYSGVVQILHTDTTREREHLLYTKIETASLVDTQGAYGLRKGIYNRALHMLEHDTRL